MADAIDFSKTHRIVLLIDLNPLLLNPNPNYLTSLLATSKILLSFPSLSSSLFSFKFFFSSLSTLLSASTLHRILPDHSSASLSFNSPSQTLDSLSNTLSSLSVAKLAYSPSNCSHTAASLLQLVRHGHDWESDFENVSDGCRRRFRDCFRAVSDAFNCKDIQFCWVDVCSHVEEPEISESDFIQNEISKFGWGFCSADFIVLGSALVSFGLIYPNIAVSSRLIIDSCRLDKRILGQLELEILDVSGKPLECKFCDLELLRSKASPKPRFNGSTKRQEVGSLKAQRLNSLNTFLGSFNDEIMKLHITSVQKHTEYEHVEQSSSDFILVQSAESGQKGKDDLDNSFTDRVFELLAGEKSELFAKHTVPTWQIFLIFLYKEGYWALLSLSNSKGDSYMGILKPFTIHSAVLSLVDNNHNLVQNACGTNLLINKNVSQVDIDPQMSDFPLGKYGHVGDGKRRKMKKHMYRELAWSSFCKAAYEFLDVDLAEIYYSYGIQKSKKLKFLKCWMKEVKNHRLSLNNMPPGPCQTGPDLNQQKETDKNKNFAANANYQESDEPFQMHICSDQSRMQDDDALVSCSETSESFFRDLPKKIQHGVESIGVDLKILAERLVSSSIYWLHKKHETMKNLDESCAIQVAEIIKLLLCEPQDLKEHNDYNSSSASEYLVREYPSVNLGDVIDKIYDQMDLLPFGEENEDQALMSNNEDSIQSWREKHERNDMSASKMIQDSVSVEVESCHLLEKVNASREGQTKEDHARMLNEARERRERARRFAYFTRRMPDLQRVWAPKQSTAMKVKPEPKRKKQMGVSYSVVCETPFGDKPSCPTGQNKSERATPVSKALFQDDR
ncbi:putative treslin [Helianthus debilis subsp. tardiflorus]